MLPALCAQKFACLEPWFIVVKMRLSQVRLVSSRRQSMFASYKLTEVDACKLL